MKKISLMFAFLFGLTQMNAFDQLLNDGPCGTWHEVYVNGVYAGSSYESTPHVNCSGFPRVIHDITITQVLA